MTVVFKLGGSLLTLPGLADRLREVVEYRSGQNCLFVTGGGSTANVVREWSLVHHLDEETAHWIAIASLDLNSLLLQAVLGWKSVGTRAEASERWNESAAPLLLQTEKFAREEEARLLADPLRTIESTHRGEFADSGHEAPEPPRKAAQVGSNGSLPHTWEATSDSLAAWTTRHWPAEELVFIKSIPVPWGMTARQASDNQYVDSCFPNLADQIPRISWCDLRTLPITLIPWLNAGKPVNEHTSQ